MNSYPTDQELRIKALELTQHETQTTESWMASAQEAYDFIIGKPSVQPPVGQQRRSAAQAAPQKRQTKRNSRNQQTSGKGR